jgi:SAM-dependent methyltransferase
MARRHVGDPGLLTALDVGCGIGLTDTFLIPVFRNVVGVDISAALVDLARQRNPKAAYDAFAGGRLPYEDGAFDIVFALCVLHHVPVEERRMFVEEMRRVTRAGGLVVVGEHNPLNPLTQLVVRRCAFDKDAVLLGARTTQSLFRSVLLEPIERRYVLILPSEARVVQRLERRLWSLPVGAQYLIAGRAL